MFLWDAFKENGQMLSLKRIVSIFHRQSSLLKQFEPYSENADKKGQKKWPTAALKKVVKHAIGSETALIVHN